MRVSGIHIYLSNRNPEISYSFSGGARSNMSNASLTESEVINRDLGAGRD